jgi:hypothetical protein
LEWKKTDYFLLDFWLVLYQWVMLDCRGIPPVSKNCIFRLPFYNNNNLSNLLLDCNIENVKERKCWSFYDIAYCWAKKIDYKNVRPLTISKVEIPCVSAISIKLTWFDGLMFNSNQLSLDYFLHKKVIQKYHIFLLLLPRLSLNIWYTR